MVARAALRTCVTRAFRPFSTSARRDADFTHAVIGGGVVGLAIARKLQEREGVATVLIEKHGSVGTETSSRNSEVQNISLFNSASFLPEPTILHSNTQCL
jgi:2-hydroxyglutarate dehydrogenase